MSVLQVTQPKGGPIFQKDSCRNAPSTRSLAPYPTSCGKIFLTHKRTFLILPTNKRKFLSIYLDGKCQTFDYYKNKLMSVLPQFRCLMGDCDFKKPIVSYFDGLDGVRHLMSDSLMAQNNFRCYMSWHDMQNIFSINPNFNITNEKISLKIISPDKKDNRAFLKGKCFKNAEILFIPDDGQTNIFQNWMNIYDDKVAMLNFAKGNEYGVLIQSREISDMHKVIFDTTWCGFKNGNT